MTKTIDKVQRTTATPNEERLRQLKQLFPECLTEGEVDPEKLSNLLFCEIEGGENRDGNINELEKNESYRFTWAGKRAAIRLLNTPTEATLKPCREDSLHFDTSQNLFIEGDNLEVLKLLYKPYFGRVKVIYIDPPYNTGSDFVYPDNYAKPLATYLQLTGQIDAEGNLQTSNPEMSGRYHSTWLSMMYPRLFLARQLLTDDGIIFVSIDDHEVHNLRLLMNEVFGEENFMQQLIWQRNSGGGNNMKHIATNHEYIFMYARSQEAIGKMRRPLTEDEQADYKEKDEHYATLGPYKTFRLEAPLRHQRETRRYEIECPDGSKVLRYWAWSESRFLRWRAKNKIIFKQNQKGEWQVEYKHYLNSSTRVLRSLLTDMEQTSHGTAQLRELFERDDVFIFDFPKPVGLIKHLLQFSTNPDSIVLDFFAGSCTTAQAVVELNQEDNGNRQFIMVQLPERTPDKSGARDVGFETIAEIGKERTRRVCEKVNTGFRVFKLAASNYKTESDVQTDDLQNYISQLEEALDPLREGWDEEDVLYEIALKEGYPLDSTIASVEGLATNTVFRITAPDGPQACHVCLDAELAETDIACFLYAEATDKDSVFICRDAALDDTLAANLALQCHLKTI